MVPKASPTLKFFVALVYTSQAISQVAMASDPDILGDFELPFNTTSVDANYFTFTGARSLVDAPPPKELNIILANFKSFPVLEGQGVSVAVLQFPVGGINALHSHPRATELLVLVSGNLQVGFVDTKNKLFSQTLQAGDMFVFPKGLVHYQMNLDLANPAIVVSVYGSANAGVVSLPASLFTAGINDTILAQSFKSDVPTIQKLKAGLAKNSSQTPA